MAEYITAEAASVEESNEELQKTLKTEVVTDKEGQYFVDQSTGQYYFQDGEGKVTVVEESEAVTAGLAPSSAVPGGEEDRGEGAKSVPTKVVKTEKDNQVVLNDGNDQYQTVTIVPSDGTTGEVSYVLIVQQPDEKDGKTADGGDGGDGDDVYDFDGENDVGDEEEEEGAMTSASGRKIKPTAKRSQQVSSAHMCNYCNYTTAKKYLLSRHIKSHSEERPHKCSVCERGFKTLASLQNHVNTHTGTKPHSCKFCDACFTTSGELVRHVRYRHTYEKPHKCTECDYASVELSKLKRHIR